MFDITLAQAEIAMKRVRQWYKNYGEADEDDGLGASNKKYDVENLLRYGVLPDDPRKLGRMQRRNVDADKAEDAIRMARERQPTLQTVLQYGKFLYNREVRVGNCEEMRALAVFYLDYMYTSTRIFAVDVPGVHGFLCVNCHIKSPFGLLNRLDSNESIIIDPWLNINCYPSRYNILVKQKIFKWEGYFKRIEDESPLDFETRLFNTKFDVYDARRKPV